MDASSRLLVVSARDAQALEARLLGLGATLANEGISVADTAFTLATGRRAFGHRAAVLLPPHGSRPTTALEAAQIDRRVAHPNPEVAMMFPGQGSQFVGMGRELYDYIPEFRHIFDQCDAVVAPLLGVSLRQVLFDGDPNGSRAELLKQTSIAQPALFVVEYALACVLRGFGVEPHVLIGHSIGEFAAACLAGVFSRDDALGLVVKRGQLMQSMPRGSMLAVRTRPETATRLLEAHGEVATLVSLAAHNAPELCVVSGPSAAIDAFAQYLASHEIEHQLLHTSHAFHSAMMDPILEAFAGEVSKVEAKPPSIPIVSGLTGQLLTSEQACSPRYWADQLRHTVQFTSGLETICTQPGRILLEVGPGTALVTSAAKLNPAVAPARVLDTLGHPKFGRPAVESLLQCLGRLWASGVTLDFNRLYDAPARKLIRLPTYPFTRSRHWVSVAKTPQADISDRSLTVANVEPTTATSPTAEISISDSESPPAPLKLLLEGRLGRLIAPDEWQRNFIEIGFDSLALTQLSGKLNAAFGVRIPFRRFFEDLDSPHVLTEFLIGEGKLTLTTSDRPSGVFVAPHVVAPTQAAPKAPLPAAPTSDLATLTHRLDRMERLLEQALNGARGAPSSESPAPSAEPPTRPARSSERFELTRAQREIWVASNVAGPRASLAYNECRSISLLGPLDVTALRWALNTLVERHEALRQSFTADGAWCTTGEYKPLEVHTFDALESSNEASITALREREQLQVSTPFDLTTGPLLRVELVRLDREQHALLVCAHHIIADGYSFGVLTRELAELYSSNIEKRQYQLASPHSFSRYAEQARALEDADKTTVEHWLSHLSGHTTDLTLPTDAPRAATRTYDSARLDFPLSETLVAKLRTVAANARVSTQTLLMAAFQLVLHTLTRQSDIVLGVPTSGQVQAGLDTLIGHCVHVLPFRIQIDRDSTFDTHARRLNQIVLDGLEHQHIPFTELVQHLNRPRDPSRIPLIPVAFGMGRSIKRPQFSGLQASLRVVPRKSESFELYVYVTEDGNGFEISWSYNSSLFESVTIAHWQRCFNAVLDNIATLGTNQRLSDIDVLDGGDRQDLLRLANGPNVALEPYEPVSSRIATIAKRYPERTAVIDASGEHDYRTLSQRANQLAHWLTTAVQEHNALVAICLDRSVDLVASMLGVWRAGLAYIPLDPSYPSARIEMILEDSTPPLVLTSRALADRVPSHVRRVFLEDLADTLQALPTTAPDVAFAPNDRAYVIFTSGSTGRPKGVVIQQRAFANFVASMQFEPGFDHNDCLLAITTVSFDIAGLELFLPLFTGGSLVLATRAEAADPVELRRLLDTHPVSVMQATPATWQMLFDSGWHGKAGLKALCGGEALPQHLASRFLEAEAELWNVYGPTETTVWSTVKRVSRSGALTIGKPIANTTLYVLDEQRNLLPMGTVGELWIGGAGVAQGYLGRADLTAERFIPSPFVPNERLYKTGDLARLRHDGEFECHGRADFQVKIRGFRIELGEIESAILKNPDVHACAVVARELDGGDKALVAYVVTRPGFSLDLDALRSELGAQLPSYMLPSAACTLNALPMTPNNKVDRNALPAPTTGNGYEQPRHIVRSGVEQQSWRQVWRDQPLSNDALTPQQFLVLIDDFGFGRRVVEQLEKQGHSVTLVFSRDRFHERAGNEFTVNPELGRDEFEQLVQRLSELGRLPDRVLHLWLLQENVQARPGSTLYHRHQEHGLYTLLHLAKALSSHSSARTTVHYVVGNAWNTSSSLPDRARSTVLGACRTVPNEFAQQAVRTLDLGLPKGHTLKPSAALRLVRELTYGGADAEVRYRGNTRQVPTWQAQEASHDARVRGTALLVGLTPYNLSAARSLASRGVCVALLSDGTDTYGLQGALNELRSRGTVRTAFAVTHASEHDVRAFIVDVRQKLGPIRTLVVSPPQSPVLPLSSWSELPFETHVASQTAWFDMLERVLPLGDLDLTVLHTNLDAYLGTPGNVVDASLAAVLTHWLSPPKGRYVTCHWGPVQGERALPPTSHVNVDRQYFSEHGLSAAEMDRAHENIWAGRAEAIVLSAFSLDDYRTRLSSSAAKDSRDAARHAFVEPSTSTERRLAELWAKALRLDRISIRDSFFDLGGHSLLAARLFAQIHSDFGLTLPLAVLVEAQTVEALAARIDSKTNDSRANVPSAPTLANTDLSLLVRLNVGTDANLPPLFVVGGAMGNVLNLRHLARLCDTRRDFYGIQARGLAGEADPHRSLVDAAAAYLAEVRRVQPRGPYYLGGFCIGGVAALEMARLLKSEGEEVALLAMLDSHLPEIRGTLSVRDRFQIQLERLSEGGFGYVRSWVREKYRNCADAMRRTFGTAVAKPDPTQYRSLLVHEAIMYARSVYQPAFYDGHITLFRPPLAPKHHLSGGRAVNRNRGFLRADNGWQPVVRSIELIELDCPAGEHDAFVLEPYVRNLAERLSPLLSSQPTPHARKYEAFELGTEVRAIA